MAFLSTLDDHKRGKVLTDMQDYQQNMTLLDKFGFKVGDTS